MSQVKILFRMGDDTLADAGTETLWATPTERGFVLDNYPFFVKGVCFGDVVEGKFIAPNVFEYVRTVAESSNSLYRVLYGDAKSELARRLLRQLGDIGCTYETNVMEEITLVAVNIPGVVDADLAWALLDGGLRDGVWEIQEGDDRHPDIDVKGR